MLTAAKFLFKAECLAIVASFVADLRYVNVGNICSKTLPSSLFPNRVVGKPPTCAQ